MQPKIQFIKLLSRAKNSGRQCHFKIWLNCHKFKKCPCLIMPISTKCQKIRKKWQLMSYNMMIGYDIYDRFTMEHILLCQSMILRTSFFLLATVSRSLLHSYTAVQKNRGHLFFAVLRPSRLVLIFYLSVSNNCFIFLIPGDFNFK
jgi:hypothetical protein